MVLWVLFLFLASPCVGRRRFVAVVATHGETTPASLPPPKAKYAWAEGRGQLTIRGIKGDFLLGKDLMKHYGDFIRASSCTIVAAGLDRTLQGAQALSRGLFGVEDVSTIPVHGAAADMFEGWRNCPQTRELLDSLLLSPAWKRLTAQQSYERARTTANERLGLKPENLSSWEIVQEWARVSPDGMKDVLSSADAALTLPFRDEATSALLAPLAAGSILFDILSRLTMALARHENTTVVYVGRPENVVAFANLLRLSDGAETWPSFSSYVAIEVQDGRSGVVLSLSRGNKEYPVPFCSTSGSCSLDAFLAMNQVYFNSSFVTQHWPSLCARDVAPVCLGVEPTQSLISFIPLWVVGGVLGAVVGLVLALLVLWRWWRNRQHRSRNEIILELEIN